MAGRLHHCIGEPSPVGESRPLWAPEADRQLVEGDLASRGLWRSVATWSAVLANNVDVQFRGSTLSHVLRPGGGARVWRERARPRGLRRGRAHYTTNPVAMPAVGSYACYVTSEGRVGEFRVANLTGRNTLTISYNTWQ